MVKAGLSDPEVRPSRRFLLYQRAEKICTGPNSKFPDKLAEIEQVKVTEAPEVGKYSKTCVKRPLKIDKTKILITNGSFMKVISIAECSSWSILQYF